MRSPTSCFPHETQSGNWREEGYMGKNQWMPNCYFTSSWFFYANILLGHFKSPFLRFSRKNRMQDLSGGWGMTLEEKSVGDQGIGHLPFCMLIIHPPHKCPFPHIHVTLASKGKGACRYCYDMKFWTNKDNLITAFYIWKYIYQRVVLNSRHGLVITTLASLQRSLRHWYTTPSFCDKVEKQDFLKYKLQVCFQGQKWPDTKHFCHLNQNQDAHTTKVKYHQTITLDS